MNGEGNLAKRANFGFEKRQRELKKKKKKEEKAARKREAAEQAEAPRDEAHDGSPPGAIRPEGD